MTVHGNFPSEWLFDFESQWEIIVIIDLSAEVE
jgi:hypothetical protein